MRDPEILASIDTAITTRDVTKAAAAKIFSGRIFDVTAAPMPGGGAVAVLHDQTEIERVEKTRRDFIANVSHELRTPLTSVQGYAETLLDSRSLPESLREFVEIIRKNASRMSRLTEDLLVLARVESGELKLNFQIAMPQELLEEAVQTFQEIAASRGIELSLMNTASSAVWVDRDAIHQVFANLIDNAFKYGDQGGKVLVGACETEGWRAVLCARLRQRNSQRTSAAALRTLLSRGQGALSRIGRHWLGPGHREACCARAFRKHSRRERAESRLDVLLHSAASAGTGRGVTAILPVDKPQPRRNSMQG